jgi:hypothetical protein
MACSFHNEMACHGYVIDFVCTFYTEAADSSGRSSPKKRIHATGAPLRRIVRRVIMASIQ